MRVVVTTVVATLLIAAAAAAPASPNRAAPGVRSAPPALFQVARPGPIDDAPGLGEPGLDDGESARLLRRLQELLREVGF